MAYLRGKVAVLRKARLADVRMVKPCGETPNLCCQHPGQPCLLPCVHPPSDWVAASKHRWRIFAAELGEGPPGESLSYQVAAVVHGDAWVQELGTFMLSVNGPVLNGLCIC